MADLIDGLARLAFVWAALALVLAPLYWRRGELPEGDAPLAEWGLLEVVVCAFGFILASAVALGLLPVLSAPLLGVPLALLVVALTLRLDDPEAREALGVVWPEWGDVKWGLRLWAWLTPATLAVFAVATLAGFAVAGVRPADHPLTTSLKDGDGLTIALVVIQAVLLAPLIEEVLFRGVILRWLEANTHVAVFVHAFATAVSYILAPTPGPEGGVLAKYGSFVYLSLTLGLLMWAVARFDEGGQADVATAALFAAVHANVWPSPVPLFVLGMGLAWVTRRSGSLLPAVVAHGLFNAVSVLGVLSERWV